jgi:hypothetical protein
MLGGVCSVPLTRPCTFRPHAGPRRHTRLPGFPHIPPATSIHALVHLRTCLQPHLWGSAVFLSVRCAVTTNPQVVQLLRQQLAATSSQLDGLRKERDSMVRAAEEGAKARLADKQDKSAKGSFSVGALRTYVAPLIDERKCFQAQGCSSVGAVVGRQGTAGMRDGGFGARAGTWAGARRRCGEGWPETRSRPCRPQARVVRECFGAGQRTGAEGCRECRLQPPSAPSRAAFAARRRTTARPRAAWRCRTWLSSCRPRAGDCAL